MKKILMMMVAMIAAISMSAQTLQKPALMDNTSVTLKGGVSALMHHDKCNGYKNFGHTLSGNFGLQFDKMITPVFGVGVEGMFGFTNGSKEGYFQGGNVFNYATVMAQAKVNMTNLFLGYKGVPHKFEVVPTIGIGWVHGWRRSTLFDNAYENDANDIATKFSLELKYNVTPRWVIVATPYLAYNLTKVRESGGVGVSRPENQPRFDSRNAWYGLELGVSYRLGKTFKVCDLQYSQADVDHLNATINDLRAALAEKPNEVVKEVVKTVEVTKAVENVYTVMFAKNSAVLTDVAKSTLDKVAGSADVVATASPEGTVERNNTLSQERADAVKTYLECKGVKVTSAKGIGVDGPASNRIATVFVK